MGRRTWRLTRAGIRLTETVKSKIRKVGSAHSGRVGKARNGVDVYHFARTEGSGEQGLERLNRPHATSLRVGLRRASPTSPRTQGRTSCTAVSASARCGPPARAQRTAMSAKMAPTPAPGCDAPIGRAPAVGRRLIRHATPFALLGGCLHGAGRCQIAGPSESLRRALGHSPAHNCGEPSLF